MSTSPAPRGAAAVGMMADLPPLERGMVLSLRMWCEGGAEQARLSRDFRRALGDAEGLCLLDTLDTMLRAAFTSSRRPLMRHAVGCRCLGGDEAALAQMVACAATGDLDDARMIAMTFLSAPTARKVVAAAESVGLALHLVHDGELPPPSRPKGHPPLI